jgi:hypothetical protein
MPLRIEHAIDLHCHFGPDTIGGTLEGGAGHGFSGLDAAREAAESGHAAIVLKSHSFASPALAQNLEQMVPGLRVFGGICTDYPSGGLNVNAVEAALALGAKVVWLPTVHSQQDFHTRATGPRYEGKQPLNVVDADGALLPVVREIADLVKQKGATLATGHTTAEEHYAVARALASNMNVLVTHAGEHLAGPHLTPQQCAELADLGATIEITALTCQSVMGMTGKPIAEVVTMLRTIGVDRCTLSTDYGWSTAIPHPASGLLEFLEALWSEGIAEADLQAMVSTTPARLLELDLT